MLHFPLVQCLTEQLRNDVKMHVREPKFANFQGNMPQTPLEAHTFGAPINFFKAKMSLPILLSKGLECLKKPLKSLQ